MPELEDPPRLLEGRCFCGATSYKVTDAFRYAMYCHCSLCRRTTGSAFKALAGIEIEEIAVSKGIDAVQTLGQAGWHNVSCGRCGSLLYAVVREGRFAHVAMGTLIDDPTIRPTLHIFVGSKAPWYTITDNLPQYDAFPPD